MLTVFGDNGEIAGKYVTCKVCGNFLGNLDGDEIEGFSTDARLIIPYTVLDSDFSLKYDRFSYTIAPGIQFVIFSRSRLDFSYKKRKGGNKNEFLVKLTYIIY